jgi:ABC-2 type transport system permease protein
MRKIWAIAAREYRASVRTKAFLVTLFLMPVLMAGSFGVQVVVSKLDTTKERRVVVVDRTKGGELAKFLVTAAEARNAADVFDEKEPTKQVRPTFRVEVVAPEGDIGEQRLALSGRVLNGEIDGFLEIGPGVYEYGKAKNPDAYVRYQSSKPNITDFQRWAEPTLNAGIQMRRFHESGVDRVKIQTMQQPVRLQLKGLSQRDPADPDKVIDASDESRVANFAIPFVLILLLFMMVMIGATPAMQGVVEEKMQKVAEVLLGSVTPFQLMLGKLLGMIGVSLTVAAFYLTGIYIVAFKYGVTDFLSPLVLAWFLVYLVLAVLMYGSLFIAIGAAANDMKETQSLLMPVIMIVMLPLFVLVPILQDPNSLFSTLCSFFPPSTPMLMVARLSVPPGIPWWQPVVGVVGVLLTTLACVYVGGRIFRVGILMQGKGAKFGDLIRWAIKG